MQTTGAAEPQQFQLAEQWRARMIEEGLAAAAEFPGGVTEPLPQLIASAQRERVTGETAGRGARAVPAHRRGAEGPAGDPGRERRDATTDEDEDAEPE